jgi:predicted metal-binding membrane protein
VNASPALESILKRDRLLVLAGLTGITLLAWGYMVHEARAMTNTGVCCCAGMKMSGPDAGSWSAVQLLPLFLMWTEMMIAMMIPSAAPMILMFAGLNRKRLEQQRPFVPTGIFVLGYLVVWAGFSAMAAAAQWTLHGLALISPSMTTTSPYLSAAVLVAAGVFQWTPLKNACLTHCRSPLAFFMTDWREGKMGAFVMGLKHGAFCTGCCWLLMAILFVAGVMNIWWVGIISIVVLLEKITPKGLRLGRVAGILLVVWGGWMVIAR